MAEAGDEDEADLVNILPALSELNPEEQVIDRENVQKLLKMIDTELSDFEKQVLDLYMTGMTYTQIAKVLGRDEKSTDNALHRMKSKIRKRMKEQ